MHWEAARAALQPMFVIASSPKSDLSDKYILVNQDVYLYVKIHGIANDASSLFT